MKYNTVLVTLSASLICLTAQMARVDAQIFDQIMGAINNRNNPTEDSPQNGGSIFRNMFRDAMSVNVPVFYDMVKNGSSMGINVLSGMVKVERGEEAERSGLLPNGARRPLSVRVFGVPVYERGTRVRNPDSSPIPTPGYETNVNVPSSAEDEELPVYT